jgi:hypothetical protein
MKANKKCGLGPGYFLRLAMVPAFVAILGAHVFGQDTASLKKHLPRQLADRYCAVFKNGKLMLMGDDLLVQNDVTLLNGDKVTINCAIIKKDGSQKPLKPGQCVEKSGNIVASDVGTGMLEPK